jgi:ABC-2 type transport system ATP-binding protein
MDERVRKGLAALAATAMIAGAAGGLLLRKRPNGALPAPDVEEVIAPAAPKVPFSANPSGEVVLSVEGLTKRYGRLVAVDDISLEVYRGETFGMLGPNGAGKTTTLEMIEGLRTPDAGRITLLGRDAVRQRRAVQESIGVQLQSQALWPELTLRTFRALFRRRVPVNDLLERFALGDKRGTLVRNLSGGQKQRLSVATAMVNDPEVVFLDEPTTGLDPQARHGFWDLIHDMQREGKTVIVTTHYMEEAEALCGRVAIMETGRVMALDSPRTLVKQLAFDNTVECSFAAAVDRERLRALPAVRDVKSQNGSHLLFTDDVAATVAGLLGFTDSGGRAVESLQVRTATLEDVFISLTGRRLRD